MRIVIISDTHNKAHMIDLPEGDVLLHAGDFTNGGTVEELVRFNAWLDQQEFDHRVIIPGNHELLFEKDWNYAASLIPAADAILDQKAYDADGLKIWGEPRQPWFYDWAFNVPREEMEEKCWSRVPEDVDILLTHGPPYRCGDLTPRGDLVGCHYMRELIIKNQPLLVACGHIHSGYGVTSIHNTVVANASVCNEQYRPVNKPIVIDL